MQHTAVFDHLLLSGRWYVEHRVDRKVTSGQERRALRRPREISTLARILRESTTRIEQFPNLPGLGLLLITVGSRTRKSVHRDRGN